MATATVNPTTMKSVEPIMFGDAIWDNVHDGGTNPSFWPGFIASTNTTNGGRTGLGVERFTFIGANRYNLHRIYMNFDLSGLPAGATISAATLKIYFVAAGVVGTDENPDIMLIRGTFDDTITDDDWLMFEGGGGVDGDDGYTGGTTDPPHWQGAHTRTYLDSAATISSLDAFTTMTLNSNAVADLQTAYGDGNKFNVVAMDYTNDWSDSVITDSAPHYKNVGVHYSGDNIPVLELTYTDAEKTSGILLLSSGKLNLKAGKLIIK